MSIPNLVYADTSNILLGLLPVENNYVNDIHLINDGIEGASSDTGTFVAPSYVKWDLGGIHYITGVYLRGSRNSLAFDVEFYDNNNTYLGKYNLTDFSSNPYQVEYTNVRYVVLRALLPKNSGVAMSVQEFAVYGEIFVPDTIPPGEITNLQIQESDKSISFSWINPIDEDFSHVNIYRDGDLIESIYSGGNTYTDTGLDISTNYFYQLKTVDISGNESIGISRSLTTLEELDEIPPMPPVNFNVVFHEYKNYLTWTSPSDLDLDSIKIYRNGEYIATVKTNYFNDTDIESHTEYEYLIYAVDKSGNESESVSKSVMTGEINVNVIEILFNSIVDTIINIIDNLLISARNILLTILGLIALIVGAFLLIGLGKKAIKRSK